MDTLSQNANIKKKPKTIYKKTLTKVLRHVIVKKRTEIKVAARELGLRRYSVLAALKILQRSNLVKERKYEDMGISYYYPNDERYFTIYVFRPTQSFVFVADSAMNIHFKLAYHYSSFMMPDENLHHFLKLTTIKLKKDLGMIPGQTVFVAFDGYQNKRTGSIYSKFYPELKLIEPISFIQQILRRKSINLLFFDFSPEKNADNNDFIFEMFLKAVDSIFVRKKK